MDTLNDTHDEFDAYYAQKEEEYYQERKADEEAAIIEAQIGHNCD